MSKFSDVYLRIQRYNQMDEWAIEIIVKNNIFIWE